METGWGNLQFSISDDGGRTFHSAQLVAQQPMGMLTSDAVPFNEWFLAESLAAAQGKPREVIRTFIDLSNLGLSVRLSTPNPIGDFALTADAKNTFHSFWAELRANGEYALLTRTIETMSPVDGGFPGLRSSTASLMCSPDTSHLEARRPEPVPQLQIPGQTDISKSLSLRVEHADYNPESQIVKATLTLMNKSGTRLRGPLLLVGLGLHSDFGIVAAVNPTGTREGRPFWSMAEAIPADGLQPKASSKHIQLYFRIDQFHSVPMGDAIAMQVRVFSANGIE